MPRGRPGPTPRTDKEPDRKQPRPITNKGGFGGLVAPGPGRPKGSRNKISGDLKQIILQALANAAEHPEADEVDYLIQQARQANPSPFMSLIGKCIPQEQSTKHDGVIEIVIRKEVR